jgi:hypothetical protein
LRAAASARRLWNGDVRTANSCHIQKIREKSPAWHDDALSFSCLPRKTRVNASPLSCRMSFLLRRPPLTLCMPCFRIATASLSPSRARPSVRNPRRHFPCRVGLFHNTSPNPHSNTTPPDLFRAQAPSTVPSHQ